MMSPNAPAAGPVSQVVVTLLSNGQISVAAQGGNLVGHLGLLEVAKAHLLEQAKNPQPAIQAAPAGLMSRLNGK